MLSFVFEYSVGVAFFKTRICFKSCDGEVEYVAHTYAWQGDAGQLDVFGESQLNGPGAGN